MFKSLLSSIVVAVLLVVGFAVVDTMARPGEKGVFECPFVEDGGSEIGGSEGKIERDGDYKVEIEGSPIACETEYTVCLCDENAGCVALDTLTTGECPDEDELKSTGNVGAGDLQAPYFQVWTGTDCESGDLVAESGMTTED